MGDLGFALLAGGGSAARIAGLRKSSARMGISLFIIGIRNETVS
jgi:hypothetical protein